MVSTRSFKKFLLDETDWTQISDNNLTVEEKQAWAVYRQSLRDLDGDVDLMSLPWPVPPSQIKFSSMPFELKGYEKIKVHLNFY